jgi:DNA-binding XRE family transcriptional regulator
LVRVTQEELAKLSDVSRPTIARLETTDSKAQHETTVKLARVLKVKPEDLASGD